MMKKFNIGTAVFISAIIVFTSSCSSDEHPNPLPIINSLAPEQGFIGDEITINGNYFGSSQGTSTVTFNGTEATEYTNWNDVEIKVKIPAGATSGKLFVTVNGTKSNESDFTINTVTLFGNYKSVQIGSQLWMTSDLDVGQYRNGDTIPKVTDPIEWSDLTTGAWCYYEDDSSYGVRLYNWYAVNDSRGLCPEGWHISSDKEWDTLADYLGGVGVAGGKLKDKWSGIWHSPNAGATDEVKFTALGRGGRYYSGSFSGMGYYGYWWTSTAVDDNGAWFRRLAYDDTWLHYSIDYKRNGFAVRCVADQ